MGVESFESLKLADAIRKFLENPESKNIKALRDEFVKLKDTQEIGVYLKKIIDESNIVILPHHIELIHNKFSPSEKKENEVEKAFLEAAKSYYPLDEKVEKVKDHIFKCISQNAQNIRGQPELEKTVNLFFENRSFYDEDKSFKFIMWNIIKIFPDNPDKKRKLQNQLGPEFPVFNQETSQAEILNGESKPYSLLSLRKTLLLPKAMNEDRKKLLGAVEKFKTTSNISGDSSVNLDLNLESNEDDLAKDLTRLTNSYFENWEIYEKNGPKKFENQVNKIVEHTDYHQIAENFLLACIPVVGWGLLIGKGLCALENVWESKPIVPLTYFFKPDKKIETCKEVKNAAESFLKYTPSPMAMR